MNNEYPRMLYKHPGREEIHGDRFDTLIVADVDELDGAIADGWAMTTTEAKAPRIIPTEAPTAAPTSAPDAPDESADRDALKAEATALGVEFPKNVPTDRLIEMIAQAKAGA